MLKVSKFKKPDDFFFWSAMIEFGVSIIAILFASFFPYVETILAQKILETVISLDGVLFGFSAVMIGLFLRNPHKLSDITLKRCLMFALLSFWSFILSILFAFIVLALGQQGTGIPLLTPIFLTLFGSLCSSIYLVMIFIEGIFPSEKANRQTEKALTMSKRTKSEDEKTPNEDRKFQLEMLKVTNLLFR